MKPDGSSNGNRKVAVALASVGGAMAAAGVFIGRGRTQAMPFLELRIFLLVVGLSLALAGLIGIASIAAASRKKGDPSPR